MVRLLIADDHPIVVQGLLALFATDPELEVLAACGDGRELLAALRDHDPDVIILDQNMPGLSGTAILRRLFEDGHLPPAILLTGMISEAEAKEAAYLGVRAIVLKEEAPERLLETIRAVARGERRIEPRLLERALAEVVPAQPHAVVAEQLTAAEQRIVRLVCQGLPNKRIARELGITEATVKIHLHRVFRKLNVANRVQLTIRAQGGGLR
ncbi:MAG: response regulator transcription factor [Gemmatimonadetes bacterium]|nr:response regulator transcription factor [Gemmatimonadota bacterium]